MAEEIDIKNLIKKYAELACEIQIREFLNEYPDYTLQQLEADIEEGLFEDTHLLPNLFELWASGKPLTNQQLVLVIKYSEMFHEWLLEEQWLSKQQALGEIL